MNNEPFHVMSQEWRYFSRQKALIHTLHLGQLPQDTAGDSVFITVTPPSGTGGFNVPPITLPPISPYGGTTWTNSTNNYPPMWVQTLDVVATSMSGTYGFSGTMGNFNPIINVANYEWPQTGGVFMVQGLAIAGVNGSNEINPTRVQLFTSAVDGVLGATIQDTQMVVQMKGAPTFDWNNQMFVEEGNSVETTRTSLIIDNVPIFTALGMYAQPASVDGKFNSYSTINMIVLRLGP